MNLSVLIARIMENAIANKSVSIEELSEAKENLTLKLDGTEILNVEDANHLDLANEYIESYGKEAFISLLDKNGDLSGAIDVAANEIVSQKAVQIVEEIMGQMIEKASGIKAPVGFNLSKVRILTGSSNMDFFPPKSVIGNCEQYRNIEGSGNCDVYREQSVAEFAKFSYSIEAWLEKV